MRVNRVSYLHYVLLFAISLICVTTGVTLWLTYKQAMVVYELNSARRMEGIAKAVEVKLNPVDVRALAPLSVDEWAKRTPPDSVSHELSDYARAASYTADDGGAFLLVRVPPRPVETPESHKKNRAEIKGADIQVLAASKGLRQAWWLLGDRQSIPQADKLYAGESVLIKGQAGDYVGQPGIWTGAAVPLKMEGGPYVLLFTAHTDFHSDLSHFPIRDLVPVIVVVFLVVMAISIFFAGHIISAIWTALKALRKLAEGDLSYRLSRRRNDEFGLLFRTYNNLADTLKLRDAENRRGSRLLSEALNSSGAPVAVCLSSGALLYASDSAMDLLGISRENLPEGGGGEVISLPKRLVKRDSDTSKLVSVQLPALDSMPQDHPELEIEAFWLPNEATTDLSEVPEGGKAVKLSLIALPGEQQANAEEPQHAEGYLLVFSSIENVGADAPEAAPVKETAQA